MRSLILLFTLLLAGATSAEPPCYNVYEHAKVFVVMSNNAYAYHKTRNCSAVKKATHKVKEVTLEEAKEMGRRPCKICY